MAEEHAMPAFFNKVEEAVQKHMEESKQEEVPVETQETEGQTAPEEINNGVVEDNLVEPEGNKEEGTPAGTAPEEEKPVGEVTQEENPIVDDWDVLGSSESAEDNQSVASSGMELGEVSKAFGIESNVSSLDELVKQVKDQVVKEQPDVLEGVPENLKEAINVAKEGGDFLQLLEVSAVDYDKVDPRFFVEQQVLETGMFTKEDGTTDNEALQEYMDSLPEVDVAIRGKAIINQLKAEQVRKKQDILQANQELKRKADSNLKDALSKLDSVANFKLNDKHRSEMFNDISSGNMTRSLFLGADGKYDYKKMSENYFKVKYFDSIMKFMSTKVSNNTKKEMVEQMTNPNLGTGGSVPAPEQPKEMSGAAEWLASMKNKNAPS